ncbi:MAG: hypothetical protein QOF78_3775 [Phycisphaerales bacterium]|jgi:hypothetical protein|nr:hypothetical protein [Phycisphaerales bacterium]
MAWRVIIRVTLIQDAGSVIRNTVIEPMLTAAGLQNTATGTWESLYVNENDAARAIARLLPDLANAGMLPGANLAAELNHIWIYIDKADPEHAPRP